MESFNKAKISPALQNEMDCYLDEIEWHTMKSLSKINKLLKTTNQKYDKQFRERLTRGTEKSLKTIFVQMAIESIERSGQSTSLPENIFPSSKKSVEPTPMKLSDVSSEEETEHSSERSTSQSSGVSKHVRLSGVKSTKSKAMFLSDVSSEEEFDLAPKRRRRKKRSSKRSKRRRRSSNEKLDNGSIHPLPEALVPYTDSDVQVISDCGCADVICISSSDSDCSQKSPKGQSTRESKDASIPDDKMHRFKLLEDSFNTSLSNNKGDVISTKFAGNLMFYCFYCSSTQNNRLLHHNVDVIYIHWHTSHKDPANTAPFRFYLVENVACYHCQLIDSYDTILAHQKKCHANKSTLIVEECDRKKCALCAYNGMPNMEHFEKEHKLLLQLDDFNPLCLSDETLHKLWDIDIRSRYCRLCDKIFKTSNGYARHYASQHPDFEIPVAPSLSSTIDCVICPCQATINANQYFQHIQSHFREYKCSECDFLTENFINSVAHDKSRHQIDSMATRCLKLSDRFMKLFFSTKVVFANGLVVLMHNLLHTKFDMSNRFGDIIEGILSMDN